MPMFMTLKNNNEVFVNVGTRIVPLNLFHAGSLSGVYEAMDFIIGRKSNPIWSYSAGSRTIIMLPKIADKLGLKRLKAIYDIPSDLQPKDFFDHWYLFKAITRSKVFKQIWNNEILFFGAEWIKNKNDSLAWKKLKDYWLYQIWTQTQFVMDKIKFNFMWSKAIETISSRRLHPKPYLIDQIKHIFSVAAGYYPVFKPIEITQDSAPTKELQQVFVEIYKLKQYLPTMMHVCTITDEIIKPRFVYYSWALPTVLEGSPLKNVTSTTMSDMREIKQIIETIEERCLPKLSTMESLSFLKHIDFDYFHYEKDICDEIHSSNEIPEEDASFLEDLKYYPSRSLCTVSRFFSGCLRISMKHYLK